LLLPPRIWRNANADRDETGAWTGRGGGVEPSGFSPAKRSHGVKDEDAGDETRKKAKITAGGSSRPGHGQANNQQSAVAGPSLSAAYSVSEPPAPAAAPSLAPPPPPSPPPPPAPTFTIVPQAPFNVEYDDPEGDLIIESEDGFWSRVRTVKLRGGSDWFDQVLSMPESALPLRSAEGLRVFKIPTFAKVTGQWPHWLLDPVKNPLTSIWPTSASLVGPEPSRKLVQGSDD
jgi:hypothetical protein